MNLSRRWVDVPAHSSLIIDVDLSEKGTEREILKRSIEMQIRDMTSYDAFIVDDLIINVSVAWISPMPLGRCIQEESGTVLDDESSVDEMSSPEASEEEGVDEQMSEACILDVPSQLSRPWHQNAPLSSCALQIFSIFIGREKLKALQIHGSIQVSAPPCTYYVFNKEASGAYVLDEGSKTLPVRHGSGVYDDCETLKIDFDLKDLESRLRIRGHVSWHWSSFDVSPGRIDKQLCSVVQGEHGFAAIHYSLFSEAVQASVVALCKPKDGAVRFSTKVFGSLIARYNNYDYTSRYNRDYYRVFVFEKDEDDPAEVGSGGVISLSRPLVAVPLGSSLIVEARLFDAVSNQGFSCTTEFRMGSSNSMVMEGESYCIYVHVKWEEVSNPAP